MKIGLLLNFHLPSDVSRVDIDIAIARYYAPIFKSLKNLKGTCSASISLSFLEVLHKFNHLNLIDGIKQLVSTEKLELINTTAYNPILHYLNDYAIEKQLVYNEYGLGYYFGRNRDFDGDKCIMINDLNGFYPADSCVDSRTVDSLVDFGYKWSFIDVNLLNNACGLYKLDNQDFLLVAASQTLPAVYDRDTFMVVNLDQTNIMSKKTYDLFEQIVDAISTRKAVMVSVSALINDTDADRISFADIKECREQHGFDVGAYKKAVALTESTLADLTITAVPTGEDDTFIDTPFWLDSTKGPTFTTVSQELTSLRSIDFHKFL